MSSVINSICFFVEGYPTVDNPEYAFIRPLVSFLSDMSIQCFVLCPQSITRALVRRKRLRPYKWIDTTDAGNTIVIYQPITVSFSNRFERINQKVICHRIKTVVKKEKIDPDIVYGHFWHCAVQGYIVYPEKPIFVATGESRIIVRDLWDKKIIDKALEHIVGVIGVSKKNIDESRKIELLSEHTPVLIAPNAVDTTVFYHYKKAQARKKIKVDQNAFIGIFVGEFSDRKGSERVIEAAKSLPNLQLIMIGSGSISVSDQVIFEGVVSHEKLVDYLNAADFFVLPTLAEGCCNAIVEAMACGLPIISSDQSFNDELLDESNSIRIDSSNIDEISNAMMTFLKNPTKMDKLHIGSLQKANKFTIASRGKTILQFLEGNYNNKKMGYKENE